MKKPESVIFAGGTRFEGSVSPDRKRADLNDLKGERFKMLQVGEIDEAIELLIALRDFMLKHQR